MTFINKYMLFSALVITCATAFASGVEQEATAGQGAAVEWPLPQPAMPQEGVQQAGRIASFRDQEVAPVNPNHTFLSVAQGLAGIRALALPANPAPVAQPNEAPAAEEFDINQFFA